VTAAGSLSAASVAAPDHAVFATQAQGRACLLDGYADFVDNISIRLTSNPEGEYIFSLIKALVLQLCYSKNQPNNCWIFIHFSIKVRANSYPAQFPPSAFSKLRTDSYTATSHIAVIQSAYD
jgi:hypothetical protein